MRLDEGANTTISCVSIISLLSAMLCTFLLTWKVVVLFSAAAPAPDYDYVKPGEMVGDTFIQQNCCDSPNPIPAGGRCWRRRFASGIVGGGQSGTDYHPKEAYEDLKKYPRKVAAPHFFMAIGCAMVTSVLAYLVLSALVKKVWEEEGFLGCVFTFLYIFGVLFIGISCFITLINIGSFHSHLQGYKACEHPASPEPPEFLKTAYPEWVSVSENAHLSKKWLWVMGVLVAILGAAGWNTVKKDCKYCRKLYLGYPFEPNKHLT